MKKYHVIITERIIKKYETEVMADSVADAEELQYDVNKLKEIESYSEGFIEINAKLVDENK